MYKRECTKGRMYQRANVPKGECTDGGGGGGACTDGGGGRLYRRGGGGRLYRGGGGAVPSGSMHVCVYYIFVPCLICIYIYYFKGLFLTSGNSSFVCGKQGLLCNPSMKTSVNNSTIFYPDLICEDGANDTYSNESNTVKGLCHGFKAGYLQIDCDVEFPPYMLRICNCDLECK